MIDLFRDFTAAADLFFSGSDSLIGAGGQHPALSSPDEEVTQDSDTGGGDDDDEAKENDDERPELSLQVPEYCR